MVLELITLCFKPLREFSAPSFTPQSESAAPLLAVLCTAVPVPYGTVLGTVLYSFSPQWESVGPLSLKQRGPQWESIV